ncbi:MAG: hypothetical protein ACRCYT_03230 [Cetobacterium sp.]
MKKTLFITTILFSLLLQGCSAVMALNGEKEPNLEIIKKGQNKIIIESQPLKPVSTEVLSNGNIVSVYHYTMGAEASAGRAVVYVLLDCFTFFISELVTMPLEFAKKKGDLKMIRIEYTPKGEVVKIG